MHSSFYWFKKWQWHSFKCNTTGQPGRVKTCF